MAVDQDHQCQRPSDLLLEERGGAEPAAQLRLGRLLGQTGRACLPPLPPPLNRMLLAGCSQRTN